MLNIAGWQTVLANGRYNDMTRFANTLLWRKLKFLNT